MDYRSTDGLMVGVKLVINLQPTLTIAGLINICACGLQSMFLFFQKSLLLWLFQVGKKKNLPFI